MSVRPSEHAQSAEGAVSSRMSGTAGNVVQTRDVHGGIHFHPPLQRVRSALRQLPADTALFTGRDQELEQVLASADRAGAGSTPGTVVICAIDGMGGIGKTALAVHAAHRLAQRFPDGQLFLDLHGFTRGSAPRDPGAALAALLSSLGVPPEQIPAHVEARAALYRDRLCGTRTLILLDNAADEAQVRPLLPAADACLVLVTSRIRLTALDEAVPLSLDVLPRDEAVALLRKAARLHAEAPDPLLLEEAVELCGRLPLALLIAGALLRTGGKAWSLPLLIDRLASRRPGHELAGFTDETRSLSAVFDLSYQHLPKDQRLLFRRMSLLPGPEIDRYAAAALVEGGVDEADLLLQRLAAHSLLVGVCPGRYRVHDLARAYARTLTGILDPEFEREAAVDRLLRYYAHTAQSASLSVARYPRLAPQGPAPAHAPDLADPQAARAWLRAERSTLEAAYTYARVCGLDGHAIALASGLAEILCIDGPWTLALQVHQAAADTAESLGHAAARASALTDLGLARILTGDYPAARDAQVRALEIYRRLGNRHGEAHAQAELGHARQATGDLPGAEDALAGALEIYRQIGNRHGEAYTLIYLGRLRQVNENLPGAGDAFARALETYREMGHRHGEANALNDLAIVRILIGDYPAARDAQAQALEIYRQIDHRNGEANTLISLGHVRKVTGDLAGADHVLRQALEILRALGNGFGEAMALADLGHVRSLIGDYSGAEDALTRAVGIFHALGSDFGEAIALTYVGHARLAIGDLDGAEDVLTRALETFRALGQHVGEANALTYMGQLRHATGDLAEADHALSQALESFRALGNRYGEVWALNRYAATVAAAGQRPQALMLYQHALAMSRELNKPDDEALALEGIADHHLATGDTALGTEHLRQALKLYQRLGMRPDADRVTARLADLPERSQASAAKNDIEPRTIR